MAFLIWFIGLVWKLSGAERLPCGVKQGLHTSNRVVTEAEFSQIHISVDETLVRISDHQTFRESKSVSLKDLQQTSSPPWIRRVSKRVKHSWQQ